jgi:hypothetical protein
MLNITAFIRDTWRASRAQRAQDGGGLFVGATTPEDMERLAERQREAIERAGRRWLLHPANEVQRKPGKATRPRPPAR